MPTEAELKAAIEKTFKSLLESDEQMKTLRQALKNPEATYEAAQAFASRLAELQTKAFMEHLTTLPDGKITGSIASQVIDPAMNDGYAQVSDVCKMVQEALNESAGFGIAAQTAPVNADRIAGIVKRLSESDSFDDIKWILESPLENFYLSTVDDHIKANADFHYKAGLSPTITRRAEPKCCKWCSSIAGVYKYSPHMDRTVFRRHENCRCSVLYDPADGSRKHQDVWTKEWKM